MYAQPSAGPVPSQDAGDPHQPCISGVGLVSPPHPTEDEDGADLVSAWVALLGRWSWDLFCSFTFRAPEVQDGVASRACDYVHPERADKLFRLLVARMNRELHGPRWAVKQRRDGVGVRWARCLELQRRGVLHYHALLAERRIDELRRLSYVDLWDELAGWARIERPASEHAVKAYCSKYVIKAGELELGGGELGKGFVVGVEGGVAREVVGSGGHGARELAVRQRQGEQQALVSAWGQEEVSSRDAGLWLHIKAERSRRWDRPVPRRWVWE